MKIETKKLEYGVNRPQSWWDEHPEAETTYQEIKQSIFNKGIKNPLQVRKDVKLGFVVEVGNQRLRAANELNINEVDCVLIGG